MASTVQTVARGHAPSGFPCRSICRNSGDVASELPGVVGTMSTRKAAGTRSDRRHHERAESERAGAEDHLPRTVADAGVDFLAEDQSEEDHPRLVAVTFLVGLGTAIGEHHTPANR